MPGAPDAAAARQRRETALLGLLALCLAGLAAWQVALREEEEPLGIAMPVRPPAAAPAGAAPGAAGPDAAAILDRPLFSEARRRAAPIAAAYAAPSPAAAAAPEPPLAASWQLIGISQADGQVTALLRQGGARGTTTMRLRSGEQLGAWTLEGVENRRALVFVRGEERQLLALPAAATRDAEAAGSSEEED